MTKYHRLDLIRQLKSRESYGVDSLRRSHRSIDPINIRLFRENAALFNESAGMAAAELGRASLLSDAPRSDAPRSDAPCSDAPCSDALPDHIENFLHSFTAAPAPAAESGAVAVC